MRQGPMGNVNKVVNFDNAITLSTLYEDLTVLFISLDHYLFI